MKKTLSIIMTAIMLSISIPNSVFAYTLEELDIDITSLNNEISTYNTPLEFFNASDLNKAKIFKIFNDIILKSDTDIQKVALFTTFNASFSENQVTIDTTNVPIGYDVVDENGNIAIDINGVTPDSFTNRVLLVLDEDGDTILRFLANPNFDSNLNLYLDEYFRPNDANIIKSRISNNNNTNLEKRLSAKIINNGRVSFCSSENATINNNLDGEQKIECPDSVTTTINLSEVATTNIIGFSDCNLINNNNNTTNIDCTSLNSAIGDSTNSEEPTITSVTADSDTEITIVWTDNADNETGFKVYRSNTDPTSEAFTSWGAEIAIVPGDGATTGQSFQHQDSGLNANTEYWYKVIAYNNTGSTVDSNVLSATTTNVGAPGIPEFSDYMLILTFLIAGFAIHKKLPKIQSN